jgi:type IX secretion system PorP/SprF family membrane protein
MRRENGFKVKRLSLGVILALCILRSNVGFSQDVQFSQYYAAPLYLNPAFTGATELTRVGSNYRNQWPGLNHSFNSYSAYLDHYMFDINSGIGIIVNANRESKVRLSTNEVGLTYAYKLHLGEDFFLRFGGQASFVARDAYFGDLVFGSQLDIERNLINDNSGEIFNEDYKHNFTDFSFGMLFHAEEFWLGISGHHLSEPNTSFVDGNISKLPMKLSAHGGMKFDLGDGMINNYFSNTRQERSAFVSFNFKRQGAFNQLDIGTQFLLEPLVFGVWYRGFPVKYKLPNSEAIVLLLGVALPSGLDIGYSYDFTISKMTVMQSGGAHEISIRYSFLYGNPNDRNRRSTIIPCFRF